MAGFTRYKGTGASINDDDASLPKACGDGDYCFYTSTDSNEGRGGGMAMDAAPFYNGMNYWRAEGTY